MRTSATSCLFFILIFTSMLLPSNASRPIVQPVLATDDESLRGLQLSIICDSTQYSAGQLPRFNVELRNTGEDDLILNLGIMLANGRKQYPKAIVLLITDSEGKSRLFDLRGPGAVGGRMDPLLVPLVSGGTYTLPVDLGRYWAASSKEFEYKLRGAYSIEARLTGEKVPARQDLLLARYWTGEVTSNRLTFDVAN